MRYISTDETSHIFIFFAATAYFEVESVVYLSMIDNK